MRIGIDLGGTKIEGVILDRGGRIVVRRRRPTPSASCGAIVAAVAETVAELEAEIGTRCSVGIGTPGAISRATGRMKNSNTTCLNGEPLLELLGEAMGREVRIANDANCFALSEAIDGAAHDAEVVFGVILGTGTGGGVVVRQRVLEGTNAVAGEWGHNPLPWLGAEDEPAAECYCGKRGCIETYLSGPGMARDHQHRTGNASTAAEIAASNDPAARETLNRYVGRLARGLASVINVVDPEVIVLGGGLSNIDVLYRRLPAELQRWVFSDAVHTRIVRPQHGDSSGVRGAAWLWKDHEHRADRGAHR